MIVTSSLTDALVVLLLVFVQLAMENNSNASRAVFKCVFIFTCFLI